MIFQKLERLNVITRNKFSKQVEVNGLEKQNIDITKVDRSTLKDINSVKIDMSQPCEDRMRSFIDQIGNPYCYKDGEMVIGIGYTDTEISLKDKLAVYACSL